MKTKMNWCNRRELCICLVLILSLVFISGCTSLGADTSQPNNDIVIVDENQSNENIETSNPSTGYCIGLGYGYEINETERGQQGLCVISSEIVCDAWRFFEGKCHPEYTYCEQHNGTITSKRDVRCSFTQECALCNLSTGEECGEWEYFNGECGP
jgi:putative hemolysin